MLTHKAFICDVVFYFSVLNIIRVLIYNLNLVFKVFMYCSVSIWNARLASNTPAPLLYFLWHIAKSFRNFRWVISSLYQRRGVFFFAVSLQDVNNERNNLQHSVPHYIDTNELVAAKTSLPTTLCCRRNRLRQLICRSSTPSGCHLATTYFKWSPAWTIQLSDSAVRIWGVASALN